MKVSLDTAGKLASRKRQYLILVCTFKTVMIESYFCFVYAYTIRKDVKYTQTDSKHFNIGFKFCNYCICRQQTIIFFRYIRMLAAAFISVFQSMSIFMHYWNDYTGNRYHWQQFDCFFKSKKNTFSSQSMLFKLCYAFCYMTNANFISDYVTNRIWTKLDKVNHGAESLWITSTLLNSMLRGNVPAWIRHCVIGEKANVTEREARLEFEKLIQVLSSAIDFLWETDKFSNAKSVNAKSKD